MSVAVFGRYVLAGGDVLRDRWVLLEGARIAAVTAQRPAAATYLDRPGRLVLPGLLNLHNHCFSEAIARSHTEDGHARRGDASIVHTVLMPLSRRGLDVLSPGERLAVARLGILQLLKGGAATVMEPFRPGMPEMFEAAAEMGIRFYGAPYVFSDQSGADLAAWDDLHRTWHGAAEDRIRVAMSPHATDTCGPDLFRAAAARARAAGVPITTHLAQTPAELALIAQRYGGRTPAEYLDWLGVLGLDLLAAHCLDSTDSDLRLMAARGATVLNCPRVFARSGRVAAFSRFEAQRVRTVVATDGYNMDLLGELNAASMISKIAVGDATAASSPALIDAVTATAAVALGRPDLGLIAPGAAADLTVVDMSHPHLQPLHDPRRALVALGNRANVDAVIVNGRVLVADGVYQGGDEAAITAAGAAAIERIWALPEAQAAFAG